MNFCLIYKCAINIQKNIYFTFNYQDTFCIIIEHCYFYNNHAIIKFCKITLINTCILYMTVFPLLFWNMTELTDGDCYL